MEKIGSCSGYDFYLIFEAAESPERDSAAAPGINPAPARPARMRVVREEEKGEEPPLVLMDYTFPAQLIPQVRVGSHGLIGQDDAGRETLAFSFLLEVHHVSGMVQGEFTEEEQYIVIRPSGRPAEETDGPDPSDYMASSGKNLIQCMVTDIVRTTRFAAAPRHLEHLPKQTYPPVNGRQGPYGHPSIRSLPPIPHKRHESQKT